MRSIQHHKFFAIIIATAILFLSACNAEDKEKTQGTTSATKSQPAAEDTVINDNEVRAEAPDALSKTEQGYALPHHAQESAQSPINIITKQTDKGNSEPISFVFHSDIDAAENLGHTIQVDFKSGSTCMVNGKDYSSKQFHFHTPSEHLVDGITFPMEMHIVNVLNDSGKKENSSFLVVALLFKMGSENNFLKEFLSKIPEKEGEKNELPLGQVKLQDLFSQIPQSEMKHYYTYKGSLTTPPYTERVQWVILKYIIEASEEQIMRIERMEGNNARHVQAVNDRKIFTQ